VDPDCRNKCQKNAEEKKEHYRKQMVAWGKERDRDMRMNRIDLRLQIRVKKWMEECEREECPGYMI
jgi:hypothetical protein